MAGLSLSVKVGKSVFIGDDIRIEVSAVRGNNAVIRFHAPRELRVMREAILKKESASVSGSGSVSVSDSAAG
jgi:carbon storage regulator CsrA